MKTKKTRNEIRRDRIFTAACLILLAAFTLIICTVVGAITNNVAVNSDSVVYQEERQAVPVEDSEASDNIVEAEPEPEPEPEIDIYPVDLDPDLQRYIIKTCEEYKINPSIVIAMCFYESSFNPDAVGDNGESMGLMGISPRWCWPEMERLNCPDMTDPYQNVTVGIDIIARKMAKYDGNPEMALMAYNAGDAGAHRLWFDNGIYSTTYSSNIMNMSWALDHGEEF